MPNLIERIHVQRERALASGDLQPTATEGHEIDAGGIAFSVRMVVGSDHKRRSKRAQAASGIDPFLPPYSDDLFVGDVSPTHVALLNKFPVAPDHLLIVTRAFESQDSALGLADFTALEACMDELDGLAFYNAGGAAGASQPHKHLQLVPLPIGARASASPAPALPTAALLDAPPFVCVSADVAGASAAERHRVYRRLLADAALAGQGGSDPRPYNLLVTRERMWIVPRTRAWFEGVGANALGYAGSLLVRSAAELETLRGLGPIRLLTEVGRAQDPAARPRASLG